MEVDELRPGFVLVRASVCVVQRKRPTSDVKVDREYKLVYVDANLFFLVLLAKPHTTQERLDRVRNWNENRPR